jgi:hypothetical protein
MSLLQRVSEGLARKTTRRSFFGRGAEVAFGTMVGVAAGTAARASVADAATGTVCAFPGPPCNCDHCTQAGVCAKPCIINTTWYASGCWASGSVTCCDCTCPPPPNGRGVCGCGSDYHNKPVNCP